MNLDTRRIPFLTNGEGKNRLIREGIMQEEDFTPVHEEGETRWRFESAPVDQESFDELVPPPNTIVRIYFTKQELRDIHRSMSNEAIENS